MKALFFEKTKKHISLLSAEFAQRVVMVNLACRARSSRKDICFEPKGIDIFLISPQKHMLCWVLVEFASHMFFK